MTYGGSVTMQTKKARYIYKAIQYGITSNKEIFEYVKKNIGTYVTGPNINYITNKLEIKGYIKSVKVGKYLTRSILREIEGQIEIEL